MILLNPDHYALQWTAIPPLIVGLSLLILGMLIVISEPPSWLNFRFLFVSMSEATWLLSFAVGYMAREPQTALAWMKISYLGVPFIPVTLYSFIMTLLNRFHERRRWVYLAAAFSIFFSVSIISTDLLFSDYYQYAWGIYPRYKGFGVFFIAFFFSVMLLTFWDIHRVYRTTQEGTIVYRQARVLYFAMGISYVGAIDFLPKFGIPIYPFGYIFMALYLVAMAYSLRRYRFSEMHFLFSRLTAATESSQAGIIYTDFNGNIIDWNGGAENLYGFSKDEAVGEDLAFLLAPHGNQAVSMMLQAIKKGESVQERPLLHLRRDGSRIEVAVTARPLRDEVGDFVGISFTHRDLTPEKENIALQKREEYQRKIVESALDAFISVDIEMKILEWNPQAAKIFGYTREEVRGKSLTDTLIPPRYREAHRKEVKRFLATGEGPMLNRRIELPAQHRDGHLIFIALSITPLRVEKGWVFNAFLHDITERKKKEEEINQITETLKKRTEELDQANTELLDTTHNLLIANEQMLVISRTDPMTGLLNRRGLQETLLQEAQRTLRGGDTACVLLIDLDDFKRINETYGLAVGDMALVEIAHRLKKAVRATDAVARIGGDEFMVLLPETNLAQGEQIAAKLRDVILLTPLVVSPTTNTTITGSLGLIPMRPGSSIEEIISEANPLLTRGKRAGKNTVTSEEGEVDVEGLQARILAILHSDNGIRTVRQPIFHLSTMEIVGYEWLSRLNCDTFGMPDAFFPMSLKANMLTTSDHACFRACLTSSKDLDASLRHHINLFPSTLINLSAQQCLSDILSCHAPERICIEISEQQMLGNSDALVQVISELKEAGVTIAMDDVGFGKSSLENLILLQPQIVKIDKTVVQGIGVIGGKTRSFQQLLKILNATGCVVIAEGVETPEALEALKNFGVNYAQGYLLGVPS